MKIDSKVTLVVASHPDDEMLGCGATLAKLITCGTKVHVLFMTDGVGARDNNSKDRQRRQAAAQEASKIVGLSSLTFLDFPDNQMDSVPLLEIIKQVEGHIRRLTPDTIFTHHGGDLNIDHRLANQAVFTACRPQQGQGVKSIFCFEVPSSTEWQSSEAALPFVPNFYIDVSQHQSKKMAALQAYADELRPWPHPRSLRAIEHLLGWRGATIGVEAAEAFMVGRLVT